MKKQRINMSEAEMLRQKAEELLKKKSFKATSIPSEADTLKLIHELQVHQIELEMQNEELKQAKEDADEATQKYTELYDFAPMGYFTLSEEGKIIQLNLHGAKMLGKERQHLINRSFDFFVSNDTKTDFKQFFDKVFRGKNEESCQVAIYEEGKLPMYVYLSGQVTEDEIRCNLTLVDITQLKYAEFALRESEEKYRSLYENANIGIGYYKVDGTVISYNRLASSHMNGVPEDFIGKSIYEVFPKQEAAFYHERIRNAALSDKPVIYEDMLSLPTKNVCFLSTFSKICDANNNTLGIQIISQDITEHKRALELMKKSEEHYRSLFDNMINGYAYCQMHFDEIDKPCDFTYISVNNAFETQTGLKNVIGKRVTEVIPNIRENDSELLEIYGRVSRTGITHQFEIFVNSLQMWFQVSVYCPQMGYIVSVFEVITERKLVEKVLKENITKLRQLNADKDRFVSILSHDLRTPFSTLIGFSEVLKEDILKLDIAEIGNIATDINKTALRTYNLLEDILTWARAQQGKIPFEPQKLCYADICMNIIETLNPTANEKNIAINYSTIDHLDVWADSNMLKTVLRNLVSNAIKFTNNGGIINIHAIQSDSDVTISVSDNGIGILPENIPKLFDIAQVLTTKGTTGETGTGLGLLLCKEFVEKHHGKIWVESEVGKGSDFKITLPYIRKVDELN